MSIEERLTKLERDSKTWRRLAIVLASVLGLLIACSEGDFRSGNGQIATGAGQTLNPEIVHEKLRVRELEVVDAAGKTAGRFTPDLLWVGNTDGNGGGGKFWVTNAPGECFVSLTTEENELFLTATRATWKRYTPKQQQARKRLMKLSIEQRVAMTLEERESSMPSTTLMLGSGEAGGEYLDIYSALGEAVVSLQANKANEGALYLKDVNGKTRAAY